MSAARSVQRLLHRRGRLRGYDALHRAERLPPQCSLPHDKGQKPEPRMYSSKQGKALLHEQTKSEQGKSFSNCQSRGALPTATEAAAQPPIDLQAQQDRVSLGVDDRSHSPELLVSSPLDNWQSAYRPESQDLHATRTFDIPSEAPAPQMIPWRRRLRSRRLPSARVIMESEQAVMRDRWSDYSQSVLRAAATPLPPEAPAMGFQPHWVLIWQEETGGPARMYVSDRPFASEDGREHEGSSESELVTTVDPGMSFAIGDIAAGAWRSYLVGIVGEVTLDEDDMQWPNQVLHGDRTRHNLRSIHDLAHFLAMPCEEDIQEHLENLILMAAERRYSRMWCWHLLKDRWGEECLSSCGLTQEIVLKRT